MPGLLRTDVETLLFHEGDGALLHRIEPITQGAPPIDSVSEIVTHVVVDLFHCWAPLEVDIHLLSRVAEDLVDHLVAKERLLADRPDKYYCP